MLKSGIYRITVNGKSYIGQAVDIKKRWKEHKYNAFYKKHSLYNSHLYNSIRKYGLDNTKFEVLFYCDEEDLNPLEEYWIAGLGTLTPSGYNRTTGGDSRKHCKESKLIMSEKKKGENHPNWGKSLSKETRLLIGENQKGEKNHMFGKLGKDHNRSKAVQMLDKKTGELIREFESMAEAERWLGKRSHISSCCLGKRKSAHGYVWRFKDLYIYKGENQ